MNMTNKPLKLKIKSKYRDYIGYFRFLSEENKGYFWHTPTLDNSGFELDRINDFIPLNFTWDEVKDRHE